MIGIFLQVRMSFEYFSKDNDGKHSKHSISSLLTQNKMFVIQYPVNYLYFVNHLKTYSSLSVFSVIMYLKCSLKSHSTAGCSQKSIFDLKFFRPLIFELRKNFAFNLAQRAYYFCIHFLSFRRKGLFAQTIICQQFTH